MSDTSYTDSGDDTQQRFTQDFPDPGIVRKPPDVDPGMVIPSPQQGRRNNIPSDYIPGFSGPVSLALPPPEPRSPMAGPHPADSNWDRFLFALSGPESSFGRNQVNRTSSARGWLQDIAGTRNQMIRQGLGDPWAGGRQNQFAVNRRYIERNFPQAAQAIARGDWNTAIRILAPNQWPSLPGGPQSTPQGVAMFNRALQRGPPQAFLGNPYPASPSDYGQPDSILKTAQSTPGLGPPGYMPQPNEMTGVLQQAMSGLMQNGSGRIAPMSLATLQFYANYLIAQRKGQTEAAKIQHARFQDQFKETLNAQQIELGRMGSCFAEAEKTKDPIGEFKQCMAAYSDSPNDPALQRALQGPNSWAQVKALLDWRHDNWLKGSKVKSQADKQGPDPFDETTPSDDSTAAPSTEPSTQPSTAAPTTTAPTTTPTSAQAMPTQQPQVSSTLPNATKRSELAANIAMGMEPPSMGKAGENDIRQAAADSQGLLARIQNEIANHPEIPADQIVDKVRAISPTLGNDLQNTIDYGPLGSRGGQSGTPRSIAWRTLSENLAGRAKPGWSPGQGGNLTSFSADNSQSQKLLGRASRLYRAGLKVSEDLTRLQSGPSPIANRISGSIRTALGDPNYRVLASDWMSYQQELDALTHGGTSTVGDIRERQDLLPWFTNPAGFRQALSNDADIAWGTIDQQQALFNRLGGRGVAIGLQPQTVQGIRNFARIDPTTGSVRGGAQIKGVGAPVIGRIYSDGKGGQAVFTAGGDPRNLRDPANWEEY